MPYIFLVFGLLIGAYALYRFFINATPKQIKALFLTAAIAALFIALFYMALTGRLAAALGLGVAILPLVIAYIKEHATGSDSSTPSSSHTQTDSVKTREDALKILGLKEEACDEDIRDAYQKLMKKVHPDHEGSEWIAAKLNQARDFLLK